MDNDGSSSVYSGDSSRTPVSRVIRAGTSTSSRPNSYTPSYMSNIQARPSESPSTRSIAESYRYHERVPSQIALKIPRRPITTTVKNASPSPVPAPDKGEMPGLLLIVFAAVPHPSTTSFLETLLTRRSFAGIVMVGPPSQEDAIKNLKIEIYALIGRLHKEIGVYTYARDVWTEQVMESVVQETLKASAATGLHGVICGPEFDGLAAAGSDVLSVNGTDLQQSWQQSVGFLHAASKIAIPELQKRAAKSPASSNRGPLQTTQNPFFLIAGSTAFTAVGQMNKSACDTLIDLLKKNAQSTGVTVGVAENLLVPERTESRQSDVSQQAGDSDLREAGYSTSSYDASVFTPSESPTKLWNMWALQNGG